MGYNLGYSYGIRVNCCTPGTIRTDMINPEGNQEGIERIPKESPLGTIGEPEDIAECVSFLVGASFVTCENITVSGGVFSNNGRRGEVPIGNNKGIVRRDCYELRIGNALGRRNGKRTQKSDGKTKDGKQKRQVSFFKYSAACDPDKLQGFRILNLLKRLLKTLSKVERENQAGAFKLRSEHGTRAQLHFANGHSRAFWTFRKKLMNAPKIWALRALREITPVNFEAHCTLDTDTDLDVLCKNAELYAKNFVPRVATVEAIGIILCERPSFDVVYRLELN